MVQEIYSGIQKYDTLNETLRNAEEDIEVLWGSLLQGYRSAVRTIDSLTRPGKGKDYQ